MNSDTDYFQQGNDYYNKKDYDNAISSYKKAIEINPKNDGAYFNMGSTYGEKQDYDNAISSYKKAIEINPENDGAYFNMGNAYSKKKDYDNAISSYKKAIEINPKNLYKENLDYIKNKIKVEKQRETLEAELKLQADMFGGQNIHERIKEEQEELENVNKKIKFYTWTIIGGFIAIIAIINIGSKESLSWLLVQSNFTALFILSPAIWSLSSLYKRKNILHLSIHDLKDKHYLISTFFEIDKENKEKYIEKMLGIMSQNSTAKLLSGLYSSKVEHIYPTALLDNASKVRKDK